MAKKRKSFSPNTHIALVNEVGGLCPLCSDPLLYEKAGRMHKGYDVAHIYPLKPSATEVALLKNEPRLHTDVNHTDNLVPLCLGCHGRFDKPRTIPEYQTLYKIKKRSLDLRELREASSVYPLSAEISSILMDLATTKPARRGKKLDYKVKTVDSKTDASITEPKKAKIKNNLLDYYAFVRTRLTDIEMAAPSTSVLIGSEIKTYYQSLRKKQKGRGDQAEIFDAIVAWIGRRTQAPPDACEVVAAYFVQNCEVFE